MHITYIACALAHNITRDNTVIPVSSSLLKKGSSLHMSYARSDGMTT